MRQARDRAVSELSAPGRPSLAETATLDAGLAQQLTVLLLRHTLAALLDHGAHTNLPLETMWLGPEVPHGTHRIRSGRHPDLVAARSSGGWRTGNQPHQLTGLGGAGQNGPVGQAVWEKAPRRYSCTACSGTRNERPTRTAVRSPPCTSR